MGQHARLPRAVLVEHACSTYLALVTISQYIHNAITVIVMLLTRTDGVCWRNDFFFHKFFRVLLLSLPIIIIIVIMFYFFFFPLLLDHVSRADCYVDTCAARATHSQQKPRKRRAHMKLHVILVYF